MEIKKCPNPKSRSTLCQDISCTICLNRSFASHDNA
ncbi:MAG: hypothetical protein Terrestrivirus1_21 [Terrestrivirus sp.]|uniref:Uncharacterized protein n=1 Tax=Terrestrivirus sp. TaxID=2487775 RepID=A0A3G4ZJY3_9VIRU|nr:MAG: hypothetical protein Terrestrivirus1_21 [Terrestrivirus sp.]